MILIGRGLDFRRLIRRLIGRTGQKESNLVKLCGCQGADKTKITHSGGDNEGVTPVPIPNTEVKPFSADGTWLETARESRSLPDSISLRCKSSGAYFFLDKRCIIYGTHGRIEIDNVNNPTLVTVYGSDGKSRGEMKPADDAKTGYEYEFKAARKAAIAGNQETEELSIKDTIEIYRFIDAIRYTWNLPFPLPEEPEKKPMTVENLNPNTKNA